MALDNWAPAIRCFNENHRGVPGARVGLGRQTDLTWFTHPAEIRLYYVVHLWLSGLAPELEEPLRHELGVGAFLADLATVDHRYRAELAEIRSAPRFSADAARIDRSTLTLAIAKSAFARLGIASGRTFDLQERGSPWLEEIELAAVLPSQGPADRGLPDLVTSAEQAWDSEVDRLRQASERVGRGQHTVVNRRAASLASFFVSDAGISLRDAWVRWKASRDSIRARFSLRTETQIRDVYAQYPAEVVLGGPPCKGFSRIGRAVIEQLREQGAHAWAHHEYGDERNLLLHKYVLFLQALEPEVFLFENVAHFASVLRTPSGELDAASLLAEAIDELSAHRLKYCVAKQIVRARAHSVPQDRERFVMVGVRQEDGMNPQIADGIIRLPQRDSEVPLMSALQGLGEPHEFVHGAQRPTDSRPYHAPAYTLLDRRLPLAHREFISWVRQADPEGRPALMTDSHVYRAARGDDLAFIERFAPGKRWMDYKLRRTPTLTHLRDLVAELSGEAAPEGHPLFHKVRRVLNLLDDSFLLRLMLEDAWPDGEHHLLSPGYLAKGNDSHGDWFERLKANRPCKTIVAHIGKDTYGYIHPFEHRALTIREAARIQTFPDWFNFGSAGIVDAYSMIGNAVPPLLASQFASRIAEVVWPERALSGEDRGAEEELRQFQIDVEPLLD